MPYRFESETAAELTEEMNRALEAFDEDDPVEAMAETFYTDLSSESHFRYYDAAQL